MAKAVITGISVDGDKVKSSSELVGKGGSS